MCWPIFLTVPNRDSDLAFVMPETYWTFSTSIKQFAKKEQKNSGEICGDSWSYLSNLTDEQTRLRKVKWLAQDHMPS